MLYIDVKYLHLLSPYLRNFKKKNQYLYNFSCPICGDSQKSKTKARGYAFQEKQNMFFKCHNCGICISIGNLIKTVSSSLYSEYTLEKYEKPISKDIQKEEPAKPIETKKKITYEGLQKISSLPDNHYARIYVENRKIPLHQYDRLFFTEDFAQIVNIAFPHRYSNLIPNEHRLVLPFYDFDSNLVGIQGRSFDSHSKLRYITVRANDEVRLVFGLDRVKLNELVYVVEGPIDSLFLSNCLAVACADLLAIEQRIGKIHDVVFIHDNEPRNKEICREMLDTIQANKKICIWPSSIKQKDINDMIVSGMHIEELVNVINNNTFDGMTAQLKFLEWRKCNV